ncbi:MAG: RNase adapter RapZ [Methylococcales bacterium]|jgi:UPF0042 nucleotide-binding protein|nr:RNase adapter RapZ [Methylococcales bacterium]MBT3507395.1 RNase adapter RapZ [Methylococcales bacterium]MBT3698793.1 RNase adapter RapZ [Methylococcales bacterium]MBT3816185.1 RNase adapter RapZ [Methylococcales bacterium]MBT4032824.1 RNase adapter RapZ [Methylococcales bacterium]
MRLVIVSGHSGAGKNVALGALEDCGFNCIDNLPILLFEQFISHVMLVERNVYEKTAIGIDARNQSEALRDFKEVLTLIRTKGVDVEVIYIQADKSALLKRYSETRRRHPLSDFNLPLAEAINIEKDVLKSIAKYADLVIDTSQTNYHQLRSQIKSYVGMHDNTRLSLILQSFGYKHGTPLDADFIFDARSLPNPYWVPELRGFTGKDAAVVDFFNNEEDVQLFYKDITGFLDRWLPKFIADNRLYLTVAIGCTGGQHRSVFLIDKLAQYFKSSAMNVIHRHRELL